SSPSGMNNREQRTVPGDNKSPDTFPEQEGQPGPHSCPMAVNPMIKTIIVKTIIDIFIFTLSKTPFRANCLI
ncbi:hypothetical protein K8T06_12320, partial [bacterium]|nr:hypothetical protein [bacterium]